MQNKFTIPLQKKNRSDTLFLQNFTKWRRINFLSSSHFTHECSPSLFAFHLNTDTPLACIHFFSSNTLLIHLVTPSSYPLFPLFFHYIETTLDKFLNFFYLIGISYQVGKLNTSETRQGWNCNSGCEAPQHCTLPRCTNVVFPQTFSGSGTVSKPY